MEKEELLEKLWKYEKETEKPDIGSFLVNEFHLEGITVSKEGNMKLHPYNNSDIKHIKLMIINWLSLIEELVRDGKIKITGNIFENIGDMAIAINCSSFYEDGESKLCYNKDSNSIIYKTYTTGKQQLTNI